MPSLGSRDGLLPAFSLQGIPYLCCRRSDLLFLLQMVQPFVQTLTGALEPLQGLHRGDGFPPVASLLRGLCTGFYLPQASRSR